MTAVDPLTQIPPDLVSAADYERYARAHIADPAWAYLQGGAADEVTLAANLAAWQNTELLPRVLRELRGGHTRRRLFGDTLAHPFLIAPMACQRLFHPEGERACALAAGVLGGAMVVSAEASLPFSEIAAHAQGPLWYQLYWQGDRPRTQALLQRAEAAGARALVLTVDAPVSGVRNREQRTGFALPAGVSAVNLDGPVPVPPLATGDSPVFDQLLAVAPVWADIEWLRTRTRLPILLKGILHPGDARRAVACGMDGLIVSNHGGRVLDTAPPTARCLPAIRAAVGETLPLLVDGGIRRGSDAFKAIALGADAVLVGRPVMHALATAGALGVAHLLRLMREELEITMALCGCATLDAIDRDALV
jgi:4-hydroxymandelate oxidase